MALFKNILRSFVLPTATGLGIERLIWNFGGCKHLILCYHGATPEPNFKVNGRHISSDQLEQQFAYFKKHFEVRPVVDFFENVNLNPKKPQLAVTFDDGFRNNFTRVLPLMEKYQVPASFFITTKCLIDGEFLNWADMIEIVAYGTSEDKLDFNNLTFYKSKGLRTAEDLSLFEYIKTLGEERDVMLDEFQKRYGYNELKEKVDEDYYRMLNSEDLVNFARSPLVHIGSHTVRHYNLSNISENLATKELRESRLLLEKTLDRPIDTIAFPDGNYNDKVKQLSLAAGYRNLLAVKYQSASDINDQAILPRFTISNTTTFSSNMITMSLKSRDLGF